MDDQIVDALRNARSLVERTKEDIDNLKGRIISFLESHQCTVVEKVNLYTREKIIHAVVSGLEVPDEIAGPARSICRSVLSGFYAALLCCRTDTPTPTIVTQASVEQSSRLLRIKRRLAPFARDALEDLQIEEGGHGQPLWIIDRVARLNANELLETVPMPDEVKMRAFAAESRITYVKDSKWNTLDESLKLFSVPPNREVHYSGKVPMGVVFRWPYVRGQQRTINAEPAITVLGDAVGNVNYLIRDLAERTGRGHEI